ncbi:Protein of unknown function [Pyronema omphalodes CBS 100304]|uniref:Uncharacterized protein n=1 Tax=Pyronema omphalodes (strain CBS 100304) TaxID=1076935 RepID=U4LV42_PYROM|nr:Protein of unknown function [Pyronema omphalodes CBS 100304]
MPFSSTQTNLRPRNPNLLRGTMMPFSSTPMKRRTSNS